MPGRTLIARPSLTAPSPLATYTVRMRGMTVFVNAPLASVVVAPTVCSDLFRPGRAMIVTVSPADAPATVPVSVTEAP